MLKCKRKVGWFSTLADSFSSQQLCHGTALNIERRPFLAVGKHRASSGIAWWEDVGLCDLQEKYTSLTDQDGGVLYPECPSNSQVRCPKEKHFPIQPMFSICPPPARTQRNKAWNRCSPFSTLEQMFSHYSLTIAITLEQGGLQWLLSVYGNRCDVLRELVAKQ